MGLDLVQLERAGPGLPLPLAARFASEIIREVDWRERLKRHGLHADSLARLPDARLPPRQRVLVDRQNVLAVEEQDGPPPISEEPVARALRELRQLGLCESP